MKPVGDLEALTRTLYGEARGEGLVGKVAVAEVVINRRNAKTWWGRIRPKLNVPDHSVEAVCRMPWQFSCWNGNDPNFLLITADWQNLRKSAEAAVCYTIAALALDGLLARTLPAEVYHYHTRGLPFPRSWGAYRDPIAEIGSHLFYRGIP